MSGFKQLNDTEKLQRRCVTRAVKLALARIAKQDPALAQMLRKTVKTGTYLSYFPIGAPPVWRRKRTEQREK